MPQWQGRDPCTALSTVPQCPAPGTQSAGPPTCPGCLEPTPACGLPAFLQVSKGGGEARAEEGLAVLRGAGQPCIDLQ